MKKLPEDFKAKWVEALRSGEFIQVKTYLKDSLYDAQGNETDDIGYCCLGVACVVNRPSERLPFCTDIPQPGMLDDEVYHVLDQEIEKDAFGTKTNFFLKLAGMNDGGNKSFAEIADWIEENL